jgi:hypothetical protein
MSYSINNTMNNTYIGDPLSVTGPSPAFTVGAGTAGQVVTTNGTGGLYWGNLNGTTTSFGSITADPNLQGSTLKVMGNAEFEGNVKIKGKDLAEMFENIESRLAILHPNPELEDKWDELRDLAKRYKELEAEIIEKEKMWAILQK